MGKKYPNRPTYPVLETDHIGMKALWCHVLTRTIAEATTPLPPSARASAWLEVLRARNWLTKPSPDFADVCHFAGYEPDRVRAQVLKRIAEAEARGSVSRRRNLRYTHQGQSLTLTEWSKRTGIGRATLVARIKSGWSIERALSKRSPQPQPHTEHTITEQANADR